MKYGRNELCNSQQTKTCHFQSFLFLTDFQFVFCFSLTLILPGKASLECCYGPLALLSNYASVSFGWSLARIRLLISQPKREISFHVPSVVVLYSFFPAVATARLDVAQLVLQYFRLKSESSSFSSSFSTITPVFPYTSCKLSHLRCYGQSLI